MVVKFFKFSLVPGSLFVVNDHRTFVVKLCEPVHRVRSVFRIVGVLSDKLFEKYYRVLSGSHLGKFLLGYRTGIFRVDELSFFSHFSEDKLIEFFLVFFDTPFKTNYFPCESLAVEKVAVNNNVIR